MASADLIRQLIDGGFLKVHPRDASQAGKLLARALRDIKTAKANLDIDEEAAYTFAYLAMLRAGRGLMFLKGYRPADGRQHKTVVDLAGHFLGTAYENLAYQFERMRRKRNQFTYEPDLPLGLKEAQEALETAREFVRQILRLSRQESPQLELGTED
ncbi:MAG: HEPN domain-containing protein [Elusimicrobia bacterium]|nr:HEPN domain-containing protein [Elusimicrobiota bacterium]